MSYQVLARKWRPKSFGTLVGQEHVVRALSHALATGRLHHAWLFTGTRGVGKTTISRILAKALNCETGVTAEPCGQCPACVAIDADRFPDYVEMDAASNRGVDDMAALLDQAVYAPVQGRYKVYMIDEVHMLTGHAFNAMLKTLEEPPEHVKFILATTDPQKIPVTVLSRCLQFNLKQMPPGHIVDHLARILDAEQVIHDAAALRLIAKAASGSMRDALSLLDQAIAHGAGRVEAEQVGNMLGAVGDDHLFGVLDALVQGDVAGLLSVADDMEARSLSFEAALQSLASLLHRIALVQFAPAAVADAAERAQLLQYAQQFDAEFLQLAYQIVIHGRGELSLAPDAYAGFTMTLLRLHAFRPEQPAPLGGGAIAGGGGAGRARAMATPAAAGSSVAAAPARAQSATARFAAAPSQSPRPQDPVATVPVAVVGTSTDVAPPDGADRADAPHVAGRGGDASMSSHGGPGQARSGDVPPWESLPPEAAGDADVSSPDRAEDEPIRIQPRSAAAQPSTSEGPSHDAACDSLEAALATGDWHAVPRLISLGGMVRELAQHCEWVSLAGEVLTIRLSRAHHHLLDMNPGLANRLGDLISERLGRSLRLKVELGEIAGETPAQRDASERRARHVEAVAALESDPFVRELIERFDATLIEASVKPL